jgi:hypothetical protein
MASIAQTSWCTQAHCLAFGIIANDSYWTGMRVIHTVVCQGLGHDKESNAHAHAESGCHVVQASLSRVPCVWFCYSS